jgi:hypothetical protein
LISLAIYNKKWDIKGVIMDINKWKSVAVRKADYEVLKAISKNKFRAPASMISKLVNDYIGFQAKKEKVSVEAYRKKLLNGKNGKS